VAIKRLKGIKRLNQTADPELLGNDEVQVLENMTLDAEYGKAKKRGAIVMNDIAKDDLGSTAEPTTIFGATVDNVDYIVAKSGVQLKKRSTGSFSVIGSPFGSPTTKADYAQYRGSIFIAEEGTTPFETDLTTINTLGIEKPDITSIVILAQSDSSSGLTNNSQYKYRLTYVTENGDESRPSEPMTYHTSSTNMDSVTTGEHLYVGYGVTMPVSTDPRVKSINIYRTKADSDVYYLLATLDNSNVGYIDKMADTDLSSTQFEYQNLPIEAKYLTRQKDRLFLANVKIKSDNLISTAWAKGANKFWGLPSTAGTNTYKYKVVFESADGAQSISQGCTVNNAYEPGGANDITLKLVPTLQNTEIFGIKRRIYRTKTGASTGDYYEVKGAQNITGDSVLDVTSDSGLGDIYNPVQPTLTYNSAVVFSEIAKPNTIPALNIINVYPDDGDIITGIKDDIDGVLVFKERSICKIYTQGNPLNWRVVKIVDNIGCDTPFSIQRAGRDYYFLSNNKIYKYPDILASAMINIDSNYTFKGSAYFNNWLIYLYNDSSTNPVSSVLYVYDELVQSWYVFKDAKAQLTTIGKIKDTLMFANLGILSHSMLLTYDGNGIFDYGDFEGSNVSSIPTKIKFKRFRPELEKNRLRMLRFYSSYKKDGTNSVTHSINTSQYVDTVSTGEKNIEIGIGQCSNKFAYAKTIEYTIEGDALGEFTVADLEFNEARQ